MVTCSSIIYENVINKGGGGISFLHHTFQPSLRFQSGFRIGYTHVLFASNQFSERTMNATIIVFVGSILCVETQD